MQTYPDSLATMAEPDETDHRERTRGARMLVMEDRQCVHETVDTIAKRMGLSVDTADNDRVACLLAVTSLVERRPYDVILIDMQMPGGVTVAQWLYRHEWQGPVVGIGVNESDEERRDFLAAGCNDFIEKPLSDTKIVEMLTRLSRRNDEAAQAADAEAGTSSVDDAAKVEAPPAPKPVELHGRVLIVEDALCVQLIVSSLLQSMNLEVDVADNGQVACDKMANAIDEGSSYDAILMDIQMPVLDGYGATRKLRKSGCTIPIIALTAHTKQSDKDRCLAAGCNNYISKPVTEANLRQVLTECLAKA